MYIYWKQARLVFSVHIICQSQSQLRAVAWPTRIASDDRLQRVIAEEVSLPKAAATSCAIQLRPSELQPLTLVVISRMCAQVAAVKMATMQVKLIHNIQYSISYSCFDILHRQGA